MSNPELSDFAAKMRAQGRSEQEIFSMMEQAGYSREQVKVTLGSPGSEPQNINLKKIILIVGAIIGGLIVLIFILFVILFIIGLFSHEKEQAGYEDTEDISVKTEIDIDCEKIWSGHPLKYFWGLYRLPPEQLEKVKVCCPVSLEMIPADVIGQQYTASSCIMDSDKLAYNAMFGENSFIVYDGREYGTEFGSAAWVSCINKPYSFTHINGSMIYVSFDEDSHRSALVIDGKKQVEYEDFIFRVIDFDGVPAYEAVKNNQSIIVVGTKEITPVGKLFPGSLKKIGGHLCYGISERDANDYHATICDGMELKNENWIEVADDIAVIKSDVETATDKARLYISYKNHIIDVNGDDVRDLKLISGQLAYIVRKPLSQRIEQDSYYVVFGNQTQKDYDYVFSLTDVNGTPAYMAVEGDYFFFVKNGVEGKHLRTDILGGGLPYKDVENIYLDIFNFDIVEGEPFYQTRYGECYYKGESICNESLSYMAIDGRLFQGYHTPCGISYYGYNNKFLDKPFVLTQEIYLFKGKLVISGHLFSTNATEMSMSHIVMEK